MRRNRWNGGLKRVALRKVNQLVMYSNETLTPGWSAIIIASKLHSDASLMRVSKNCVESEKDFGRTAKESNLADLRTTISEDNSLFRIKS